MSHINRRNFLQASATATSLSMMSAALRARAPKQGGRPKKLLFVFGRGGNDALNTFIPNDTWYTHFRSTSGVGGSDIAIPASQSLPIPGQSYVRAHPQLLPVLRRYVLGRGAVLGRVGNPDCKRSHFTEMRIVETGRPGTLASLLEEGWGARLLDRLPAVANADLKGVSHTSRGQRLLFSKQIGLQIPAIPRVYTNNNAFAYTIAPSSTALDEIEVTWRSQAADGLPTGSGIESAFARDSESAYFASRDELEALPALAHDAYLFPRTEAEILSLPAGDPLRAYASFGSGRNFLAQMEEAMHVLGNSDAAVCGVDIGGYDTHGGQLADQDRNLAVLAKGLASADQLAQLDTANDYVILFMTEFGRTVKSNGNDGTDHGIGTAFLALGDTLRSGVYNMTDPALPLNGFGAHWDTLDNAFVNPSLPTGTDINAVSVATDYRIVFGEVLQKHFAMGASEIDAILPAPSGQTAISQRLLTEKLDFLV